MPGRLHVVVTGDTNCGKTTLINACLGEPILPAGFQSETSVITYCVPQRDKDSVNASLYAYRRCAGGRIEELPSAVGAAEVHRSLKRMNREARESNNGMCIEARVTSPLRRSLRSLLPESGKPADVVFLDIGGPNETMNTSVHPCAELAYSLSHKLVVCVKHDQTRSHTTQHLVEDIRAKAPYHFADTFDDAFSFPLVFVITQVDQVLDEGDPKDIAEILRRNLRSLLRRVLPDCPKFVQNVPIIAVSARSALEDSTSASELQGLTLARAVPKAFMLGTLGARLFRAAFDTCGASAICVEDEGERRFSVPAQDSPRVGAVNDAFGASNTAATEASQTLRSAAGAPTSPASPAGARDEWAKFERHVLKSVERKDAIIRSCKVLRAGHIASRMKPALERYMWSEGWPFNAESLWGTRRDNAAVAGTCMVAVTVDAVTAGASMASAGNVAAAAAGANAAASSMKAWLFGQTAAVTANATAKTAAEAMFMVAWSAVDAANMTILASHNLEGIFDVAGMRFAHATAVGAGDARETLMHFMFDTTASDIKSMATYVDVIFYPEDPNIDKNITIPFPFSFQLKHANSQRLLFFNGSFTGCAGSSRSNQMWWGIPVESEENVFTLQSADYGFNLGASKGMFSHTLECTAPLDGPMGRAPSVSKAKQGATENGHVKDAKVASIPEDKPAESASSPSTTPAKGSKSTMEWRIHPGTKPGTVRLENVAHKQFLHRSGFDLPSVGPARESVGLSSGCSSDQDWIIVPRRPLYIGEFKGQMMNGNGMMFWPDGSPAFKGVLEEGKLKSGFIFNECGVCHGHFAFREDGSLVPEGAQPDEVADPN